jgi:tRNA (Thr-GGU) A37 N-methylase
MDGSRCFTGCTARAADLVLQSPRDNGSTRRTFALRSPVRPNPIGTSIVRLIGLESTTLLVRGLDCLNGTPLLDLKPDRKLVHPVRTIDTRGFRRGGRVN